MKIFLQDKQTRRYLTSIDQWAESSEGAMDFPNYDKAVEFAQRHALLGIQVVLKFPDHPYHICLPYKKRAVSSSLA